MTEIRTQEPGAFPVPEDLVGIVNQMREDGDSEEDIRSFIELSSPPPGEVIGADDDGDMEATEPGESPSTLPVAIPSNEESTPVEIGRGFL